MTFTEKTLMENFIFWCSLRWSYKPNFASLQLIIYNGWSLKQQQQKKNKSNFPWCIELQSIKIKLKIVEASQKVAISTFRFTAILNMTLILGKIIHCTKKLSFLLKISLANVNKTADLLLYTPWKYQETFRFSDVFRGYRKANLQICSHILTK